MKVRVAALVLSILAVAAAGCAAQVRKESFPPVFYPEPPDLPRIHFLTWYTGAKDIEPPKSGFERFVTGEAERLDRLDKPYGVAAWNGKLYVCDTNGTVMVFDLEKKTYSRLHGAQGMGKLLQPLNIFIDRDGTKFVTDPIRGQVVVFDRNDFYVTAFGSPGAWRPTDVVALDDRVYVTDAKSSAVVVFDRHTGERIKSMTKTVDAAGDTPFVIPTNLAVDKDGYLYVSDSGRFQVLKLDRDGNLIKIFGRLGTNVGHFARPRGVAVDREGRLYAVDAAFEVVQIFDRDGQMLLPFGRPGRKPGDLYLPAAVTIDYDHVGYFRQFADPKFEIEYLIFVTNQFGERLVNVFAYGRERGRKYPTEEELRKSLQERLKNVLREGE